MNSFLCKNPAYISILYEIYTKNAMRYTRVCTNIANVVSSKKKEMGEGIMAYKIGEFTFDTPEEARKAKKEAEAIAYITKQMKSASPQAVLKLYQQMLEKDLFQTKLGLAFLTDIYDNLKKEKSLAGFFIPPVPGSDCKETDKKKKPVDKQIIMLKKQVHLLMALCITMAIIIVGMFVINATSTHPTVLNYEEKLIDKYAGWEKELTEREAAVYKKEQQLKK